jgi:CTP synthase (UTP-ammonia lyase)
MCSSYFLTCALQIVPHVTNAIQDWIERVAKIPVDDTGEEPDVCIIEVIKPLTHTEARYPTSVARRDGGRYRIGTICRSHATIPISCRT